jgi:hypothetical protein
VGFTDRVADQARQGSRARQNLQRPRPLSARYGLAQSIGVVGGSDKSRHKLQPAVAITRSQHSPTRKDRRTSSHQKRYRQNATSTIEPKRKRSKNQRRWSMSRRSGCRFASCRVHQPSLLRSFGRESQSRFQLAKQRRLSRRSRKAKADASHGLRVAQPCAAHQGKACPA